MKKDSLHHNIMQWVFRHLDHLLVCVMFFSIGGTLKLITDKVNLFNPIEKALEDFHVTDIFFDILHHDKDKVNNKNLANVVTSRIIIVDMADLHSRDDIAQIITDIKKCHPKVLGIDLIFEKRKDSLSDEKLFEAISAGNCQQVLSCKLLDYFEEKGYFTDCVYSYFKDSDGLNWGYTNLDFARFGGVIRDISQRQVLNGDTAFSFPYLVACYYQDIVPKCEVVNVRRILYDYTDFYHIDSNKVLQNADRIKDNIVLLGTLKEEGDMLLTPIGKKSGVEVMAYSIMSYLDYGNISYMSKFKILIITFLLCLLGAWTGYKIEKWCPPIFPIIAKIFNFVLMVILIGVSFYLFVCHEYYVELLYPLLGLALIEDIRELYTGIIKWLAKKTGWYIFNYSVYV